MSVEIIAEIVKRFAAFVLSICFLSVVAWLILVLYDGYTKDMPLTGAIFAMIPTGGGLLAIAVALQIGVWKRWP